ncbi:hypothetical protein ACKGJO_06850 [Gracilimonas sp. Q87]|uniref:hypothetical protein n=1 Tax=Gracilimonas sp. Q87 TaxID=3384766 RepID=UPI0039840981
MNTDNLQTLLDSTDDFVFEEFRFDRFKGQLKCGTVGCLLGHYATISDDWEFTAKDEPKLKESDNSFVTPLWDASDHFDLSVDLTELIFCPLEDCDDEFVQETYQRYIDEGIVLLGADASKEEVVSNVQHLIENPHIANL